MARVTVEDCLERENNRFSLVILAAQRAKELLSGAKSRVMDSDNKHVVTALREIANGQVRFMTPDDLAKKRKREEDEREAALTAARERASTASPLNLENGGVEHTVDTPMANGNGSKRVALELDAEREALFTDTKTDDDE